MKIISIRIEERINVCRWLMHKISWFADRSAITKGSHLFLSDSLRLIKSGGRPNTTGDFRLINDADSDDANQICHLYLMSTVMNSLFPRAEETLKMQIERMDVLDATRPFPSSSFSRLLYFSLVSRTLLLSCSLYQPKVLDTSWFPNEIPNKRNVLMDRPTPSRGEDVSEVKLY